MFNHHQKEEKIKHTSAANYRKCIIPKIRKDLSHLADDLDIDRALLFEYSNGTSNLVGLPFLYATATIEVVKSKIASVSNLYQKMNVSLFAEFIHELEDKSYYYFNNIEEIREEHPMVYNYMKPNGVKSALFYALYDDEESIGFIMISGVTKKFERDQCLPKLAQSAQLISSLLNYDKLRKKLK